MENGNNKKSRGPIREILDWIVTIGLAIVLASFLQIEVFALTQVNQSSMNDTLVQGQNLFVWKTAYHKPKRGDIVVFLLNDSAKTMSDRTNVFIGDIKNKFTKQVRTDRLIKRVIGIAGDKVDIIDGQVYLNDELLNEPYAKGLTFTRTVDFPIEIPEGKLLVLGDNREVSKDSRSFGLIDEANIEGKAIFRLWPFDKFGKLLDGKNYYSE